MAGRPQRRARMMNLSTTAADHARAARDCGCSGGTSGVGARPRRQRDARRVPEIVVDRTRSGFRIVVDDNAARSPAQTYPTYQAAEVAAHQHAARIGGVFVGDSGWTGSPSDAWARRAGVPESRRGVTGLWRNEGRDPGGRSSRTLPRGPRRGQGRRVIFWEVEDDAGAEPFVRFYVRGPGALGWAKNQGSILGSSWEGASGGGGDFAWTMVPAYPGWQREAQQEYRNVRFHQLEYSPPRAWIGGGRDRDPRGEGRFLVQTHGASVNFRPGQFMGASSGWHDFKSFATRAKADLEASLLEIDGYRTRVVERKGMSNDPPRRRDDVATARKRAR